MKKIYFSLLSLLTTVTLFAQVPTCSLNTTFIASNKVGVWPDSVTNFVSGTVGQPYVQNLTVKVPKDTVASGVRFCFNRFVISNPTSITNFGLPPGLNLGSSTAIVNTTIITNGSPAFKFPGNANNCASIYGTPTVAGSYTLHLEVQPWMTAQPFGSCSNTPNVNNGSNTFTGPQTLNYYIINIASPTGVMQLNKDKFGLMENYPNPFTGKTTIKYYVEGEDEATLAVFNALGAKVYEQKTKTQLGENTIELNATNWKAGVYFYSVTYKNAVNTKRFIIAN